MSSADKTKLDAITGTHTGTNTGDQTITLTGDVGTGTGSFAATIANDAVTLAKMANMATASLLGRNTAGTGDPEVLSYSTVKTALSLNAVENTALSTWAGTSNVTTLGTVGTGTWSATTIAVNKGGTGQTSYTDGQLLIGNSTGNTLTKATLTGTATRLRWRMPADPSLSRRRRISERPRLLDSRLAALPRRPRVMFR